MAFQTEQEKVAHLLRRFGLGASEAEMDYYGAEGLKGAIDRLVNFEAVPDNWEFDLELIRNANGAININSVQAFWHSRILTTNRPLVEKMTIFWHDHFATSAEKVDVGPVMHQHIELIRSHALGKFPDMLEAVSKDPAMLYWLDSQENVRGKANENFAREVMELFTLGIGKYSEKDVQEAARSFTGWTFGREGRGGRIFRGQKPRPGMTFVFDPDSHDDGEKTVLGRRGNFGGEDVLKILCEEPATPRFIVKKMWEWFAYPSPELNLVERLATLYRASGLDTKVLVRAIMESPEFYSEKAKRGVIKSPVDFCASTARALGIGAFQLQLLREAKEAQDASRVRRPLGIGALVAQTTKGMGMSLLAPPDVAGWEIGQGWISSATMVERIKWADRLFGMTAGEPQLGGTGVRQAGQLAAAQIAFLYQVVGEASDPEDMVDRLLSVMDAPGDPAKKSSLVEAARRESGGRISPQNVRPCLALVARGLFGSPEYQFA